MAAGIPTAFQIGQKVTPQTASSNYVSGTSAKGAKWATNYLRAKKNPFDAAIAAASLWLTNVNKAGTAGFTAGLSRVNQAQVATQVAQYGPTAYTSGVTAKSYKYTAAITNLLPEIQQIAANLPPRGDLTQNLNRAVQMATQLAALRGKYRG